MDASTAGPSAPAEPASPAAAQEPASAAGAAAEAPDVVPPPKVRTAEELAEDKRKLEERIKERRRQREEEERLQEIEREKNRRQTGSAIVQLREKVELEERVRAAEQQRREKKEDAIHRQRILEEIKRDRENQRNRALAAAQGISVRDVESEAAKPAAPVAQPRTVTDQCRLAIRLPDGSSLQQDFNARESLAAVKLYVQLNRKDVANEDPVSSAFTFRLPPAIVFTEEDLERPLVDLGLCPSSRLVVVARK